MNDARLPTEPFVPPRAAAVRLGVPASWLEVEAKAGRIPHLRVGRRILLNPQTVEHVLMARARKAGEQGVDHA